MQEEENPVKRSVADQVIEWTMMNDYWATFNVESIMDMLESLDAST